MPEVRLKRVGDADLEYCDIELVSELGDYAATRWGHAGAIQKVVGGRHVGQHGSAHVEAGATYVFYPAPDPGAPSRRA